MGVLAKGLLRFLVDISSESLAPELRDLLLTRASRCLLLLDHCSHGRLRVGLYSEYILGSRTLAWQSSETLNTWYRYQ